MRGICASISLALGLALIAPTSAPAQSQSQSMARVCVNVPQGTDFDSGYAPFVLVLRDKGFWTDKLQNKTGRSTRAHAFLNADHIPLAANFESHLAVKVRESDEGAIVYFVDHKNIPKMNFGYNCSLTILDVHNESFIRKFDLEDVPFIDAVTYGNDDFCADDIYIQRFEGGELIGTRRFINDDLKCWGDDLSGAAWYHTLKGQPVTNIPVPLFASAAGKWEKVCRTVDCVFTITEAKTDGEGGSDSTTNSRSSKTTESISAGLEYEGFSASASLSKEETKSVTTSITRNFSESMTRTKSKTVPYSPDVREKMHIASIWQYVITNTMDRGDTVVIYTDFYGCSSNDWAPTFAPGTDQSAASCQGGLIPK